MSRSINGSDCYPFIVSGVQIWQHPSGAIMYRLGNDGFPDPVNKLDLNDFALQCITRCSGTRTFKEILTDIGSQFEGVGFDITLESANFLVSLLKKNFLSTSTHPAETPIPLHGSQNRYSPMHFSIELTDYCNLTCLHCYRQSSPHSSRFLDTAHLLSLMDDAARQGITTVELTGGEPTCHPDFLQIACHAAKRFTLVAVLTNGTLMTDEILEALASYKDNVIFQVDLDGMNAYQHEKLRGLAGSFESAKQAIKIICSHNFRVRAAMNVYKENVHSINQTCQAALQLGATWFAASPVLDVGRGNSNLTLDNNDLDILHTAIEKLHHQHPHAVLSTDEFQEIKNKSGINCGAGWRSITIGPDTSLRPCIMFPSELPLFGHAKENSLKALFSSNDWNYFAKLAPPDKELCGDCLFSMFCRGCFARPFYALEKAIRKNIFVHCKWAQETSFSKHVPAFDRLNKLAAGA